MTHVIDERTVDDIAVAWCLRLDESALHPVEQQDLDAWLSQDPAHRQRMDTVVNLWEGIERDAHAPELLTLRQQALAAVQRAGEQRWSTPSPRRWPWLAAAAAALVLALGMTALLRNPSTRYTTRIGEQRTIALEDGSILTLDADSAVAVNYSSDRRDLTLERGRASFKVAKNPLRPFAVASGHHMVVATGTAFSVERLASEVRVALYEGHVAVLRDVDGGHAVQFARMGHAREAAEQALTPGNELIVSENQSLGVLRTTAASDTVGGGQLSFTNEPLATAVERVNRYNVVKRIEVAAEAAGIRISGVFNAGDTDAFARGVAAAFPVRVTLSKEHIVLMPRTATEHTNQIPN